MRNEFTHGQTRYVPGQTFGRETSRGWGRNPKRTLYREWTRWTYSEYHRAWVHDGKTWHPLRATRKQILAGRDGA
jgi:hypothetical protein